MLLPRNHHLQISSCLAGGCGGGGGRAYAFDLEILKSPLTSSSPSSTSTTLSESSNSGLTFTTRKPRTPRKRPNQTYNEAAALLSTAYPNLFSPKLLASATNSRTFSKSPFFSLSDDSSELFFPFRIFDVDDSTFLMGHKPSGGVRTTFEPKFSFSTSSSTTSSEKSSCLSPGEFDSSRTATTASFCPTSSMDYEEENGDFNYAESILDEEADDGGGIDSIMGNLTVQSSSDSPPISGSNSNGCFGCPTGLGLGLGFELGFGMRRGGIVWALRHHHENENDNNNCNWWGFPTVHMEELSPRFGKGSNSALEKEKAKKKKMKMKKVAAVVEREKAAEKAGAGEKKNLELPKDNGKAGLGLLLKLNYDGVLSAWSDKGSPFSDEADAPGNDVAAWLTQIDLFPETGGVREASVLRYKEKRRTRLFSKKIRYQVRKVNADRRPRMKGRFVRRPNSKHE